ncbi:MAG: tol-pal system protein YbgF [Epsilonproteobacteria bacterium]|nr:tol-pal system protein YbgF [Campylobacterota bacterium]
MNIVTLILFLIMSSTTVFAADGNLQIVKNQQRIEDLRASQASLTARYEGMLSKIAQLTGRFDEFKHFNDKITSSVDENRNGINRLSANLATLTNTVKQLANKIKALESGINKIQLLLQSSQIKPTSSPTKNLSGGPVKIPSKSLEASNIAKARVSKNKPAPVVIDDYSRAVDFLKKREYKKSLNLFGKFIKENPDDKRIDLAYFNKGEIYFSLKQYDSAIIAYDQIVTRFPRSEKIADAMLKEGICFLKLGDSIDAKYLLEKVVKGFPGSEQAKSAKNYLSKIK